MRGDTLKRHMTIHPKSSPESPGKVEGPGESEAREIALELWKEHSLHTFKDLNECLRHFDSCSNKKWYEEWSASYAGPFPMVPPYEKTGELCPFCIAADWRRILQKAKDAITAEKHLADLKRRAVKAELKAQLEALEED